MRGCVLSEDPVVKMCQMGDGTVVKVVPGGFTHFEDDLGDGWLDEFIRTFSYGIQSLAAKIDCYGKGGHQFVFWARWVPWKDASGQGKTRYRMVPKVYDPRKPEVAGVLVRDGLPQIVWERCRRCRMWAPTPPRQEEATEAQVKILGISEFYRPKSPIVRPFGSQYDVGV